MSFTNNREVTSIEVDKKWLKADGTTLDWPEDVTVDIQLTADGQAVEGKTATLSADQTSYEFEGLPKYQADGTTEIAYSVTEVEVAGYVSVVGELADGKITITNTENVKTSIPFKKIFYGTGAANTFEFKLTSLGEAGQDMWASDTDITLPGNAVEAEEPLQDDGEIVASMTKTIVVAPNTEEADGQFGEVQYAADGDYYYAIEEVAGGNQDIVYDEACYLAHVKITDNKVDGSIKYRMLYPSGDGTYDYIGEADVPEFYNNEEENDFVSMRFHSAPISPEDVSAGVVSVYPEVQKTVNNEAIEDDGATTAMVPGEFMFELREGNDGKGELIATASNDGSGRVAFFDQEDAENIGENWGLVFVSPGTYEYTITEQKGTAFGVKYDDAQILMTVEVAQADDGELSATVTYAKDGEVTDMPTFNNTREGMDLQVHKRSRSGGEGLANCTYALWMHSSTGDVMLQEAVSDATGLIKFENVVLIPGQKYFYKEVEAPAGHTVDPYRTAYWTVEVDENGKISTKIIEETADDGWHSKYENNESDKQSE